MLHDTEGANRITSRALHQECNAELAAAAGALPVVVRPFQVHYTHPRCFHHATIRNEVAE